MWPSANLLQSTNEGQNLIPQPLRDISPHSCSPLGSFFPTVASFEDSIVASDTPTMIQGEFIALESAFVELRIGHRFGQ